MCFEVERHDKRGRALRKCSVHLMCTTVSKFFKASVPNVRMHLQNAVKIKNWPHIARSVFLWLTFFPSWLCFVFSSCYHVRGKRVFYVRCLAALTHVVALFAHKWKDRRSILRVLSTLLKEAKKHLCKDTSLFCFTFALHCTAVRNASLVQNTDQSSPVFHITQWTIRGSWEVIPASSLFVLSQ